MFIAFFIAIIAAVVVAGSGAAQAPVAKSNDNNEVTEQADKTETPSFAWINKLPKDYTGALQHKTFRSPSMKLDVGYCILLPPDYDTGKASRYPVVYYLHGGRPGSEAKSTKLADMIHDVFAAGEVAPAIYVFPNGGPVSHYNMPNDPQAQSADVFIHELIPHIDRTFRTIPKRSARAIEGFSQGGRATMRLSLRYPELFCSAAAGGGGYATEKKISESDGYENDSLKFASGDNTWDLARAYVGSQKPPVRWMIYVGSDGINYENNLHYMQFLDSIAIKCQRLIVPDQPHSASRIYEQSIHKIMGFHAANFAEATSLEPASGRSVP